MTADFSASKTEVVESIDTLSRAISILENETAKNPAAFTQINPKNTEGALQAFSAILDAASLSGSDQKQLTAIVRSQWSDDAEEDELSSPATAAYKTHSGNILDVLEDLKEKAWCCSNDGKGDVVGLGTRSDEVKGVSHDPLWNSMMLSLRDPVRFLPCSGILS